MTTYNFRREAYVRFNVNSFLISAALSVLFHAFEALSHSAPCTDVQCKTPSPGSFSLIVTNEVDLATIAHLPTEILNLAVQVEEKLCYEKNEEILLVCANGYVDMRDQTTIQMRATCLSNGSWFNPILNCQRKKCGKPKVTDMHRLIGGGEFAYDDIITYECTRNYKSLAGYSVCQADGTWSSPPPKCEKLCTEDLHDLNGTITSPNYPNEYPSSINCFWEIKVPEHLNIAIWYRDFKVEVGKYTFINCKHDYFVLMDHSSGKVDQFCGSRVYKTHFTTGHHVVMTFSSDRIIQDRGFLIQYTTYPKNGKPVEPYFNTSLIIDDRADVYYEYAKYGVEIFMTTLIFISLTIVALFLVAHFVRELGCCHMRYKEKQIDDPDVVDYRQTSRAKIVYSSHAGDVIRVGNPEISNRTEDSDDDGFSTEMKRKKISLISIVDDFNLSEPELE